MKLFLNKVRNLALQTKALLKRLFFSMEHIFSFLKYVALILLVVVMSFRFYHQANEASEMYSIEEFSGSEKLVKNNWIKTLASEISSNCLVLNKNLDQTIKSRSEKFTSSRSTSIQQLRKSENPTVAVRTQSVEKNDKFDIKGIMAAGLNLFEIKEKIISGSISEDTISKTYHLTINTPFGINDTVNVSQNCPDALSQLSKRASVKISQIINPYAWVDSFIFAHNFNEARVILEKLEARRSYDADFKNSESDSVKIVHRWVNYYVSQAKLNLDSVDFDLKKKDGKSKIYFHRRIEALKTAEHYIKIQLEGKTNELSFSCLKVAVIKDIILSVKNYKQYQIIPNYFNEDSNLIKLARDCYNTTIDIEKKDTWFNSIFHKMKSTEYEKDEMLGLLYTNTAVIWGLFTDDNEVERLYKKAILKLKGKRSTYIYNSYAYFYRDQAKGHKLFDREQSLMKAVYKIKEAIKIDKFDANLLDSYAEILLEKKDTLAAIKKISETLAFSREYPVEGIEPKYYKCDHRFTELTENFRTEFDSTLKVHGLTETAQN